MSDSPTLTSLLKPLLLEVMSLLDAPSLKHLRLTNKLLKCIADELITSIKYGTARDCCSPVQLECGAKRWPSVKILKLSFLKGPYEHGQADFEEVSNSIECLVRPKWTAIEEVEFPKAYFYSSTSALRLSLAKASALLNISGANALAACTVSWGKLRKLRLQRTVCPNGLDVLATHGDFPSLEELDLSSSHFTSNKDLAGAALAKLASRAPKLCTLTLHCCQLGDGLIPLLEIELPNLEMIDLAYSKIDDEVLSKLDPEKWPGLSTLLLEVNLFRTKGLEMLLRKDWRALKDLDLSFTNVDTTGIGCLIAATCGGCLSSLTSLGFRGHALIWFEVFLFGKVWNHLERLSIGGGNFFHHREMSHFINGIQAGQFPALKSLTMQGCDANPGEDVWDMLLILTWNQLEELTLFRCWLGFPNFDELALTGGKTFPKLRSLAFKRTRIIDEDGDRFHPCIYKKAIEKILHAPWPSLMRVELEYYKHAPEEVSGWKVTKKDDGDIVVMERI